MYKSELKGNFDVGWVRHYPLRTPPLGYLCCRASRRAWRLDLVYWVLRDGCSAPVSKAFWDCEFEARHCILIRAFRRRGQDSESYFDTAPLATKYRSKPTGVSGRIQLATLDGETYLETKRVFL